MIEPHIPKLIKIMKNDNEDIGLRKVAAEALGNTGYEKALKPLNWMLTEKKKEINDEIKIAILKAIARVRFEDQEIKLFVKNLKSKSNVIKELAKNQLITLEPEKLITMLLESLKNEKYSEKHKNEIINLIGFELSSINVAFPLMNGPPGSG